MTNLVEFPDRPGIRLQASIWIARLDSGLSLDDRAALERWLAASPEHAQTLLELSQLWDDIDVLAELSDLFPLKQYTPQPVARSPGSRFMLAALATACIVLVGWGLGSLRISPDREGLAERLDNHTFETEIGGQSSVRLSDSSLVMLNTNSRVDVSYEPDERVVVLRRGEAHFDVARDPSRPFRVYAGDRIVEAVGTAFNVRLGSDQDVKVTVTEGSVHVMLAPGVIQTASVPAGPSLPSLEPVVAAGEVALVDERISEVRKLAAADMEIALAWQQGMLIFRGDPLDAVLEEVGRYTTVEFELSDQALGDIKVGGYFRAGDIDALLIALENNFGIQATTSGRHILLAAE